MLITTGAQSYYITADLIYAVGGPNVTLHSSPAGAVRINGLPLEHFPSQPATEAALAALGVRRGKKGALKISVPEGSFWKTFEAGSHLTVLEQDLSLLLRKAERKAEKALRKAERKARTTE